MRLAVAFNDDGRLAAGATRDAAAVGAVLDAVRGVEAAAAEMGWPCARIAVRGGPGWATALLADVEAARADVIVNLVETVGGEARLESAAAWLLELSGVPCTGSPPTAIALALDKAVTKAILASRGVAVPAGALVHDVAAALPDFPAPWMVKPSREDASHGIDAGSVVSGESALRDRVAHVLETYRQPAMVEEYVDGRELNVAIVGEGDEARTLPLAEIDFSRMPAGVPRIVTYSAKWEVGSAEDLGTRPVEPEDLEPALAERTREAALAAYRALGLRDYGRVDVRLHPTRGPLVLEVNANPDLSPDAGLARAASRAGLSHVALLERIVRAAHARSHAAA